VAYGLGTPAWAYATLLWGNALAAGCLMAAFAAAVALLQPGPGRPTSGRDRRLALAVGLAASWAVVAEYQAAPAACLLVGLALLHTWRTGGGPRLRRLVPWLLVGVLVPAIVLAAYNTAAFGAPWRVGYEKRQATAACRKASWA
jgi:hypothetical protein